MMFTSTTTALAAGNTWTSPTLVANTADNITGSVYTDQAGSLFIDQSADGTNWDVSKTIAVVASTVQTTGVNEVIVLPYVRVRFTNTAGAPQTLIRLYINLRSAGVKP